MQAGTGCPLYLLPMRDFATTLYKSKRWQETREAYAKSVGYLCERCLARGLIVPGEIVHHKIHVEPWNVNDASVTLNWDNLQLLCRQCHGEVHSESEDRRYKCGEDGSVRIL